MTTKGWKTLYRVSYLGWDGESRDIDPITNGPIETVLYAFVYAFYEDEAKEALSELGYEIPSEKIIEVKHASESELAAFNAGHSAHAEGKNSSFDF